jgi:hypothetical protein
MKARLGLVVLGALAATALVPATALASFHFVKVREVYPGSVANPNSEYIELQMFAPGQNLVDTHTVTAYSAAGASEDYTFNADVDSGANQATMLIASTEAETQFGVTSDLKITKHALDPSGGAVCWEQWDCVEWGNFTGAVLTSPTGDAEAAIPDGQALRRSIAPGCATLLENADDTDDSAVDFAPITPGPSSKPRPNSVTPTEKTCAVVTAPQTTITAHPRKRTKSRKAHFEFSSDKPAATVECGLDGARYAPCSSPVDYSKLKRGRHHHFEVRATAGGKTDPTGATFDWKVKKKKKRK